MTSFKPLTIAFFGTPDLCTPYLEAISKAGHQIKLMVTAPDRKSGRGMRMQSPPVKIWADQHNIKVLQPEKLDTNFASQYQQAHIDMAIVIAYGKIIPQKIIDTPKLGTLNVHYSLLPRHRGAAPVEAAILAGDTQTGVSIQQMVFKLDAGPVWIEKTIPLSDTITGSQLRQQLTDIGPGVLLCAINHAVNKDIVPRPQNENQASIVYRLKKTDGLIDLDTNHQQNWRKYRAFDVWPRTYFMHNDTRHIITEANFTNSIFTPTKVIPAGGKEINWPY